MDLPEIKLNITGKAETNLADYKTKALEVIKAINTDLNTDNDFTVAKLNIKELKTAEENLKQLKIDSLKSVSSIYEAFALIDEITEKLRSTRLDLNRITTKREKERRIELVKDYITKYYQFIEQQFKLIPETILKYHDSATHFYNESYDFDSAIKGKKSVSGCEKALDVELERVKLLIIEQTETINTNYKTFQVIAKDKEHYFTNLVNLLKKPSSEFSTFVKLRLLEIEKAEREQQEKQAPQEQKTREPEPLPDTPKAPIFTKPKPVLDTVKTTGKLEYKVISTDYLQKRYFNYAALFDDIEKTKRNNFLLSDNDLIALLSDEYPGVEFRIN